MGLPLAGILGRFTSQTASSTLGFGVGVALAEGLRPEATQLGQEAWKVNPSKAIEAHLAAKIVAQAVKDGGWGEGEAVQHGIDGDRFAALLDLELDAPAVALALTLYRRGLITDAMLDTAFAKEQLEPRYWPAIKETLSVLLSPAEVANAVQQGHLPNNGILPAISPAVTPAEGQSSPDTPDGQPPSDVPLTTIELDPLAEVAGTGVTLERLQVLANLAGLPPGPETLLAMWNRGLITEEAVDAGIREGHMKTKWTGAFKRMRWAVLSGQEYASAHLRQWVTEDEMYAGGALTGHTKHQMDLLFLNRGRPASPTQMWRAWARGVTGPRGVPTAYEDHAKAIAISDIRPEYAEMLWETRYNYPSLFQLNRLVTAGIVDADTGALWAHKSLYAPEVVAALKASWTGGSSSAGKKETETQLADEYEGGFITETEFRASLTALGYTGHTQDLLVHLGDARRTKRYRDKAIDAIAAAYTNFKVDDTRAAGELAELNVTGAAKDLLLAVWRKQRIDSISLLTPAQVKKAYSGNLITQAQALQELEWRHYTPADASTFLSE